MKSNLKERAIELRKQGLSYREIMEQIPIAKSTLSDWLHSVGLAKHQKQRLTEKKLASLKRGWAKWHQMRVDGIDQIIEETASDVTDLNLSHLWLVGVMLYWAEGSKERERSISQPVNFNNSDPRMIRLFIKWLIEIIHIPREDITFSMYIHVTADVQASVSFWAQIVSCEESEIKVYFKRHSPKKTNRTNTGENYHGVFRVSVKRSSTLNRRIAAWTEHVCRYWGVV